MVRPADRKEMAFYAVGAYHLSIRQACQLTSISRWVFYHRPDHEKDEPVRDKLRAMAEAHPGYGFWKMYGKVRREGHEWNHKRVYRLYLQLGMNIRRRAKRRLPQRLKQPLVQPVNYNQVWSMDFMSDALMDGRRFRVLNIIDDFNREVLAVEADTSLPSARVIRVLDQLTEERGLPRQIRVDNGPEFISNQFSAWCAAHSIEIKYTQPGKPTQNAYIERLNRSFRTEILDAYLFSNIHEVRRLSEEWVEEYNNHRPHEALKDLTPKEFLLKQGT